MYNLFLALYPCKKFWLAKTWYKKVIIRLDQVLSLHLRPQGVNQGVHAKSYFSSHYDCFFHLQIIFLTSRTSFSPRSDGTLVL